MTIFKARIEEHNGEQEYVELVYVDAPTLEAAELWANRYVKDWYYGAYWDDVFEAWCAPEGYPMWTLDGVWEAEGTKSFPRVDTLGRVRGKTEVDRFANPRRVR